MNRTLPHRPSPLAVVLLLASPLLADGQVPSTVEDPDPERFAREIEAFASWDEKNYAPPRATVFVGSSSIRFWPTAERFPDVPLINRGFGGAHISDVVHFVDPTVLRYRPDVVVFYAGDNDIAAGKGRDQVLEDYRELVEAVLHAKPSTQIVWLPIKPSRARWSLWPEMRATNELVAAYTREHPNLHVADVATPMLGPDGEPPAYLFVQDGLHMTAAGYDIWTEVVARTLARLR